VDEVEGIFVDVLDQNEAQGAFEFVDGHTIQINSLDQVVYSLPTKCHRHQQSTRRLLSQQQYMYNLKDNVLHARKVEGLHSQLRTILNVDSQMDFISVVVLYAQHQAQIAPMLTLLGAPTILLEEVDQLVQHCVVERLYVLYYEEDGALLHALLLQDLLDTLESLF